MKPTYKVPDLLTADKYSSLDGLRAICISLVVLPINLLLIALVSYCSYYFFEKRFLQLKERFK